MIPRSVPYIQTLTGAYWYPFSPRPEDVHFNDLRAISRISRFGGHTTVEFYSVAEHSVRVARELRRMGASPLVQLAGLYHDAHEAYPPGDQLGPFLRAMGDEKLCNGMGVSSYEFNGLLQVERRAKLAVRTALGVLDVFETDACKIVVKHVDMVLLATERRDLMAAGPVDWGRLPDPIPQEIRPWSSEIAWARFCEEICEIERLRRTGQ